MKCVTLKPLIYKGRTCIPVSLSNIVLLKLRGNFVDIMCDVNSEHIKNVIYDNGKKVLYLQVLRAIYSCVDSALLWYELFAKTLVNHVLNINPHDCCVANKSIHGKQDTITFYVDENKICHKYPKVVTTIIDLRK